MTLAKLILVLCMSFSIGPALLHALQFGGKIPQLDYKIKELEKLMSHPPVKQGKNGFEGEGYNIEFKDIRAASQRSPSCSCTFMTLTAGV